MAWFSPLEQGHGIRLLPSPEFAWSPLSPEITQFPGESVTIQDPTRIFSGGLQIPFSLKEPWEFAPFCLAPLTAYRFNHSGPGPEK